MKDNRPVVVIVCNAIDDATRIKRQIFSDSPAATKKVFQMCEALQLAGVRPYVFSLGRGRVKGTIEFYPSEVARVNKIITIYAPFWHLKGLSQIGTLIGLVRPLRRLSNHKQKVVIFYNCAVGYLGLLGSASLLGYRTVLDLEDGNLQDGSIFRRTGAYLVSALFNFFCKDGALLACSALSEQIKNRRTHLYYGAVSSPVFLNSFQSKTIRCLLAGTLEPETGAVLLLDVIKRLRTEKPVWASKICFDITGVGESKKYFEELAGEPGFPALHVHGRLNDSNYTEVLRGVNVGLALKPVGGPLADTTFPSKVIEFASHGLLVVSTDISDVRQLLGNGARYLRDNQPETLIRILHEIILNPAAAAETASNGRDAVEIKCSRMRAGADLVRFICGK